ncbi:SDR family NAD(P)-dependent oxidoreductase [Anderseniella sp. Alg231-50]|uniref:SDR family NAD(P)-dependent oxidoreductase n=1 Tax=Anderseniella sp. Alg231-50 TaxID=1922226 RepID=UPI000D55B7E9
MSKGIALVTGAGSGIGRACATALATDGWTVVLTGRRENALQQTISEAGEAGAQMQAIACDVTDPASVEALYAGIDKAQGRIDVVFNNAGTNVPPLNLADLTYDQWRQVIGVNLDGAFLIAKGAFTMMRDQTPQGGRIINNGSISAHVPRPGSAPYTASKHAITGLTRCISLDGREFNIGCSQIDIGNAASAMTDAMKKGVPQADGSMKPEPVMDVSHVASSVVYMAGLPPEANVQFMTVMATNMPFIGRG